jgi:hypothetical protein
LRRKTKGHASEPEEGKGKAEEELVIRATSHAVGPDL